jgi:Flp pilus assembly pilin Flp
MRESNVAASQVSRQASAGGKTVYGRIRRTVLAFHREEQGVKSVEALLLIFVAAIILIGMLRLFFPELLSQVKHKLQELFSSRV